MSVLFSRVAVLGTGLIGGSFALALRRSFPETRVVGWDKAEVLPGALERGAVQEIEAELGAALRGAELVYVALPVGMALDLLPEIARTAEPSALVTDACSTKVAVCRVAEQHFTGSVRFLGGHPMAGKEVSGIAHADQELFRGAKYALIGEPSDSDPRVQAFARLIEVIGAQPVWLDADTHDWAVAIISHLPQMVALALARVVAEETDETGLPLALAGPGLRDMLRLAGASYELWRDISLTNAQNLARALDRLAQAAEYLRTVLARRELGDEFLTANDIYKKLRELQ